MRCKSRRILAAGAVMLLAASGMAWGQSQQGVRFNLSTPGARSLAMGGAFLGLADDATAAYTNPAGLTNLMIGGSEVAVEFRQWDYSTSFIERGNLLGKPLGIGLDTVDGLERSDALSEESGLSFLSVGYVLPQGFTLAVYHHQLARYATSYVNQGTFVGLVDDSRRCQNERPDPRLPLLFNGCRTPPGDIHQEIQISNTGASVAYVVEHPALVRRNQSLSIGFGVSLYELKESSRLDLLYFNSYQGNDFLDRGTGGLFGPADTLDDNVYASQVTQGEDRDFATTWGFLWKFGARQRWSLGGVYRQGPGFAVPATLVTGLKYETFSGVAKAPGTEIGRGQSGLTVPDIYGLGLAYSTNEGKLKIALDINRVGWSARLPDIVSSTQGYRLEDTNEVHLGIESVLFDLASEFVGTARLGVWNDPAHEAESVTGSSVFPPGEDDLHWSGGIGLVIKEDFQIDAAIDLSDRVDTVSFSVVRFF